MVVAAGDSMGAVTGTDQPILIRPRGFLDYGCTMSVYTHDFHVELVLNGCEPCRNEITKLGNRAIGMDTAHLHHLGDKKKGTLLRAPD